MDFNRREDMPEMNSAKAADRPNLTWIRQGLWVAAFGFSAVTVYGLAHGVAPIREQLPASTALIALLSLKIVKKHPRLAACVVLAAVWWDLTVSVFMRGTFNEVSLLVFPVIVIATGLLLGSRSALIMAAICAVGMTAAGFCGGATLERLALDSGREGMWLFASVICTFAAAVMMRVSLASYAEVLDRSERERLRFQGLFEYLPEGLIGVDAQGAIVEANDAATRLLGSERISLIGRKIADILAQSGLPMPFDISRACELKQTIELTVDDNLGVPRHLELMVRPTQVPEAPVLVLLRDLTHRKLIEQHLGHAQRLEAVGMLAGGIAHDFNNLLTAIGGSAEIITMDGDAGSKASAQVILAAQRRGSNLTRQLLAFARRDVHKPGALDLAGTVGGMSQIIERLLGRRHHLLIACADPVWVEADAAQVEQVVLNLVTNACDAMPDGGNVSITVRPISGRDAQNFGSSLSSDRQALLEVSDTGTGIPPELRVRIFEPFYTTKERGKGTGLGLAAVQGIVAQNQGSLNLESEMGVGTKFRIFFATVTAPNAASGGFADTAAIPAPRKIATGRLLFVDDDESVLKTVSRILESDGYEVLAAANGVEALKMIATNPAIDLVVTDLAMPGMDGRELGEHIHRLYPGRLPILYISGYFNDPGLSRMAESGSVGFLAKPFSREQLLAAVRAATAAPV